MEQSGGTFSVGPEPITGIRPKEADMADANAPNIALDLLRIHSIITRALSVTSESSQRFAQEDFPDASTKDGFLCYARSFVSVLHSHHLTEDELGFPYFREKLPDAPYDLLMDQHKELASVVDEVKIAIEDVSAYRQAAASLNKLNLLLRRLADLWQPHIGIEEGHFTVAKLDALISREEHIKWGKLFAETRRAGLSRGTLPPIQLGPGAKGDSNPEHAIFVDPPARARGLESAVGLDATILALLMNT
jgi:hemerythrin-like domain-containing protein